MKKPVAALTMVGDDYFFLRKWIKYYGDLLGADALYVANHGGDPIVTEIALDAGCSVISVPGHFDDKFDMMRWRFLTEVTNGLRQYYEYVICGDVDELIVPDPDLKMDLVDFLGRRKRNLVITPLGLEIVHRPGEETAPITDTVIGPRRYCRFSTYFCKPSIIGVPIRIARGGHYTDHDELKVFRKFYLFHLKWADRDLFLDVAERRMAVAEKAAKASGARDGDSSMLSAVWHRSMDEHKAKFDEMAEMPLADGFDFTPQAERMHESWGEREGGLYGFRKEVGQELYHIPDRFIGIL